MSAGTSTPAKTRRAKPSGLRTSESSVTDEAVDEVAHVLVSAGRVVPALTVEPDGRARSWWWPMPASTHRGLVASIVEDHSENDSQQAQRSAADRLAEAVDAIVRRRLCASKVTIAPPRPGRPTVTEAWARSLVVPDPWLAASLDPAKVRSLADEVQAWVRSGSVIDGRFQLCLRVHEPAPGTRRARQGSSWKIELLARDRYEPSLVLPLDDIWSGRSPFGASAFEDALGALGRAARLAPELSDALEAATPGEITVEDSAIVTVLTQRLEPLNDAGIAVLLPSWWSRRPKLGLRAKATSSPASLTDGGVGMDSIIEFTWEAALDDRRLTKADIAALTAASETKQALVRIRGEWVEVGSAPISQMLAAVGTAGEATAGELLRAGLGLDDLGRGDDLEVVGVDASKVGWLDALLGDALHATIEPVATPQDFDGSLREYQERGVGWLRFLGRIGLGACLADDMGLGKTAQLIATVLADRADGPTLVVCPVSVLGNWHRELQRFAPSLAVGVHHGPQRERDPEAFATATAQNDVVLTTYSLLARDADAFGALRWGRVVFDEAQQIKNPGATQTKAAQRIGANRRVALTGTPVENRLSELWSIMNVLNPGLLGTASEFRERFASPIEREHDPDATERLRRITGPFVLRRLKTDRSIITDLPDKVETVDRCPLTREQATLYRAVVDDLIRDSEQAEGITRRGRVLAGLLRLKQVCNHPAQFLADGSALGGRSGKLTRTEELLDEILAEGDKVLCFTQFTAWGEMLAPYLQRRLGVEALWLHGGLTRKARDKMVERFATDDGPPLFLISLKAGGTGLNLTAASHVIHLDRWWNPAVEDQATDRAYRIGQKHLVQVHKLVTSGTVEERIDEMITAKRDLAQRVVGAGEDWLTELSTTELAELVALRDSEAL